MRQNTGYTIIKKALAFLITGMIMISTLPAQIVGSQGSIGTGSTQGTSNAGSAAVQSLSAGQAGTLSIQLPEISPNALLAMSSPEYMVTPGDIYNLAFNRGIQRQSISLLVEGDGVINAGFLGRIQARGMKFSELKELLLKKVSESYADSNPSLLIVSTGTFPIIIKGEVKGIGIESAWGLSRLAQIVKPYLTPFSSQRTIRVISKSGSSKTYDLLKADRFGDLTQNPVLQPGDVIEVKKAERIVSISGAVKKPGNYELLSGEGIGDLIQIYADGTLPGARTDSLILTRRASAEKPESENILFDLHSQEQPFLANGDVIKVPSLEDSLPIVYIEGAIQSGIVQPQGSTAQGLALSSEIKAQTGSTDPAFIPSPALGDAYGIVRTVFRGGQRVSEILKPLRQQISSKADLANAYILREKDRIPLNLEQLLYHNDATNDVTLIAGDRIVIPYGYAAALIRGEVKRVSSVEVKAGLRLSDALKDNLTERSFIRAITVTGANGKSSVYDLFKAERFGDLGQNPMLRPGDVVDVKPAERIVQIEGEVKRPGKYQLNSDEGIDELVSYYADGPTAGAKLDLVVLTRKASLEIPESEQLVFDIKVTKLPPMYDGDTVRIPSQEEFLPVVYIEGAIAGDPAGPAQSAAQSSNAYSIRRAVYRKGLLVSNVIKPLKAQIYANADLARAYIVRGGDRIPINLEKILYFYNPKDDVVLHSDDRIVIPTGLTTIAISGEVKKASSVELTSSMRLADALKDNLTSFSSTRDILITSRDGKTQVYDLFMAERKGDAEQNPLLRPGDVIEVRKAQRIVQVVGEVRRPGFYQLMQGEGVLELLQVYADGILPSGKTDSIVLTRMPSASLPESESIVFSIDGVTLPELQSGDVLRIPNRTEYLPIVYIEGAIASDSQLSGQSGASQSGEAYAIRRAQFRKNQLLSQVMKPLESKLLANADLRNAYIARGTERIAVNLERLLYFYNPADDIALQPEDHIVIPFGLTYAQIKGEVKKAASIEVTSQSRLADVIRDLLTPYSSVRDIQVTNLDGTVSTFDVFKAERFGDAAQNPYIRPGDIIEIRKAERIIRVEGEVRRPGSYQLRAGEGVKELIDYYADGVLIGGKADSAILTRRASIEKPASENVVFDLGGPSLPVLSDGDSVRIPSREEYLPVVYVEGAVRASGFAVIQPTAHGQAAGGSSAQGSGGAASSSYGTIRVAYREGQLLSQVIRSVRDQIDGNADLSNAYLVINAARKTVPVNCEKLLFRYEMIDDIVLAAGDRLVIPYRILSVYVKGEVKQSSQVTVTGQIRLSEVIKPYLTEYSSTRDIVVTSSEGQTRVYDLFRGAKEGDANQDPLVRPGDVIEIKRANRIIRIEGEVRRQGAYQLRAGEGVKELIEYYADGVLPSAKVDSLILTRKATAERPASETVIFDAASTTLPTLKDGDVLRIPSREEFLPIVYVEGAVIGEKLAVAAGGSPNAQPTNYSVLRAPYRENMTLSLLMRSMKEKILFSADLAHAFIVRKGEQDPIRANLEEVLFGPGVTQDIVLRAQDRIVIPFGSMNVFVTGEVTKSSWVGITGLTRLNEVVAPLVTRYSSLRDVTVKSLSGAVKTYDLFKAERFGDITQNPFLEPGDEIRIRPLAMLVTVNGEVKRPGSYQLLPGEGLKDLIEYYADGFTEKANPGRIQLVRYLSETQLVGEKKELDYRTNDTFPLKLFDVVTVPSKQELQPVVWFEGAVGVGVSGANLETSQRIPFVFMPGETVSQAAQANRKLFSAVSDIANAYVVKTDGRRISVNLARFIYDYDFSGDMPLEPNDVIIVPFRQFFVTVSGAVRAPGRYPYVPDRNWEYYIGLAGGFDTERNQGQKIAIYDVNSKKVNHEGRKIQPEDNIVAAANSFTYQLMRWSSILSTVLSLVVLIFNVAKL